MPEGMEKTMNGISVMNFVQVSCGNRYGKECDGGYRPDPDYGKYITISPRGTSAKRAAAQRSSRTGNTRNAFVQKVPVTRDAPGPHRTEGGFLPNRPGSSAGRTAGHTSAGALRLLALALVFSGMLAGFRMMTRASNLEKEQTWKYYTTVTLGYGEDMTDIIYRYCDRAEYADAEDYLQEICSINSLPYHRGSVPVLSPGTQIVIPYFSSEYK